MQIGDILLCQVREPNYVPWLLIGLQTQLMNTAECINSKLSFFNELDRLSSVSIG